MFNILNFISNFLNLIRNNLALFIIFYILLIIGQWKVFEKAGYSRMEKSYSIL